MKRFYPGIALILLMIVACSKGDRDTYSLNSAKSEIEWRGSSPVTENVGTFSIRGNDLKIKNGKLVSGSFEIPINSLNVTNLPPDLKPQLTEHLKSADFFNVAVNPLAKFKITDVQALKTPPEGAIENANATVTGQLTMIGVTKPVTFAARIVVSNHKIDAEAQLEINRTDWGMNYAADPALGEHHILPMVKLHIKFEAEKN